jgi:hypothetical protein
MSISSIKGLQRVVTNKFIQQRATICLEIVKQTRMEGSVVISELVDVDNCIL